MDVNSVSSESMGNNTSDEAFNAPRSAADSVANAFSSQLAQVQADLAASKAYAVSVEAELANLKAETATMVAKQSQEISKIKIDSEIKSQAISSGLIDLDCLPLLNSSEIKLDENGNILGIDSAIADLKSKKPFLFSDTARFGTNNSTSRSVLIPKAKANTALPVKDMSESEYKRSLKKVAPSYARRYN